MARRIRRLTKKEYGILRMMLAHIRINETKDVNLSRIVCDTPTIRQAMDRFLTIEPDFLDVTRHPDNGKVKFDDLDPQKHRDFDRFSKAYADLVGVLDDALPKNV